MSRKIISIVVLLPLAIVIVLLCVANRQAVTLALNPFRPEDKMLAFTAPFFVFLFLALIPGMLLGSVSMWFSQGKHRKRARIEASETIRWHDDATRQRAVNATQPAQLPAK